MLLSRTLLVLLSALAASAPVRAAQCPTEDAKLDAIMVFIEEHYPLNASMIYSVEDDPTLFPVSIYLYDDDETVCEGTVRVSDECEVSDVEVECITGAGR